MFCIQNEKNLINFINGQYMYQFRSDFIFNEIYLANVISLSLIRMLIHLTVLLLFVKVSSKLQSGRFIKFNFVFEQHVDKHKKI